MAIMGKGPPCSRRKAWQAALLIAAVWARHSSASTVPVPVLEDGSAAATAVSDATMARAPPPSPPPSLHLAGERQRPTHRRQGQGQRQGQGRVEGEQIAAGMLSVEQGARLTVSSRSEPGRTPISKPVVPQAAKQSSLRGFTVKGEADDGGAPPAARGEGATERHVWADAVLDAVEWLQRSVFGKRLLLWTAEKYSPVSGTPLPSSRQPARGKVEVDEAKGSTEVSAEVIGAAATETIARDPAESKTPRKQFLRTAAARWAGFRDIGQTMGAARAAAAAAPPAVAAGGEGDGEPCAAPAETSESAGTPREAGMLPVRERGVPTRGVEVEARQRRRVQHNSEPNAHESQANDDDEAVSGFGSVGLLAFLVCFGLLFCVMEVAKCYCLFECRRRQRSRRRRAQGMADAEGRMPVAVSRPVPPSVPEARSKDGWVEVVIDGMSLSSLPEDEKAKDVPSAKGYAVADASHALQEAIEHAQRLSPRGARVVFIPSPPAEPPELHSSPTTTILAVTDSLTHREAAPASEQPGSGGGLEEELS